jgi:hypothetical protein
VLIAGVLLMTGAALMIGAVLIRGAPLIIGAVLGHDVATTTDGIGASEAPGEAS